MATSRELRGTPVVNAETVQASERARPGRFGDTPTVGKNPRQDRIEDDGSVTLTPQLAKLSRQRSYGTKAYSKVLSIMPNGTTRMLHGNGRPVVSDKPTKPRQSQRQVTRQDGLIRDDGKLRFGANYYSPEVYEILADFAAKWGDPYRH